MTEGSAAHAPPALDPPLTDPPLTDLPGPVRDDRGHHRGEPTPASAVVPDDPALSPGDAELLRAHVAGDAEAFAALVARHQDRLWAVALGTMRNPDEAADALQDAYVAAFRHAGSFRGESQVSTWLHRIVVNACLDRLRRSKVRAADPLPPDVDRRTSRQRPPPADPAEVRERHEEVLSALAQLNPEQRAALVLVDLQGYSVAEASAVLDCPVGTVKSRCARGRARLLPLLSHLLEDGATP